MAASQAAHEGSIPFTRFFSKNGIGIMNLADLPEYPSASEVDDWCSEVLQRAKRLQFDGVEQLEVPPHPSNIHVQHTNKNRFLCFQSGKTRYYGLYQPNYDEAKRPLLLHLPGYGAPFVLHPSFVYAGYNVLHIDPQGHYTPEGKTLGEGETPSTLPDTIASGAKEGYSEWLAQVIAAIREVKKFNEVDENKVAVMGSSQGGGCSLLLASILSEVSPLRAVAADTPYLSGFREAVYCDTEYEGGYEKVREYMRKAARESEEKVRMAWRALGLIDTHNHSHRLDLPILFTAGGQDKTTPPFTIRPLLDKLGGSKSFTCLSHVGHWTSPEFTRLALTWFQLYCPHG